MPAVGVGYFISCPVWWLTFTASLCIHEGTEYITCSRLSLETTLTLYNDIINLLSNWFSFIYSISYFTRKSIIWCNRVEYMSLAESSNKHNDNQ
jgi:hypothetical protein